LLSVHRYFACYLLVTCQFGVRGSRCSGHALCAVLCNRTPDPRGISENGQTAQTALPSVACPKCNSHGGNIPFCKEREALLPLMTLRPIRFRFRFRFKSKLGRLSPKVGQRLCLLCFKHLMSNQRSRATVLGTNCRFLLSHTGT